MTELTYLEILRSYGLFGAVFVLALLSYPFRVLARREYHESHYVLLAYLCYLIICVSNPLLFSSSGMLVLALVVYKVFLLPQTGHETGQQSAAGRELGQRGFGSWETRRA